MSSVRTATNPLGVLFGTSGGYQTETRVFTPFTVHWGLPLCTAQE